MEKLQVLFPFSSSSELSTAYPSSSSNNMANTHVFSSFQGDHFLGLKTQTYNHHQVQVPQLMVKDHQVNTTSASANDDQISARFAIGSSENEEKVPMKINKKGEKKVKKPKYAFQTRSQVDILDDGYRWRKYGQKAVKNNKFPRSYYRCTYQGCNVKKQVQRLTKDEGVVVTTYEGVHSHPIEKTTDNFEHILSQMQIYTPFNLK